MRVYVCVCVCSSVCVSVFANQFKTMVSAIPHLPHHAPRLLGIRPSNIISLLKQFYNKLGRIPSITPSDIKTLGTGSSAPISTYSPESITASNSTNRETITPKTLISTRSPTTSSAVSPYEKGSEVFELLFDK
jgi:hypothetical protein